LIPADRALIFDAALFFFFVHHVNAQGSLPMFSRMVAWLTAVSLLAIPMVARSADTRETSPAIIIRVDSINNLIEDAKYLAELAGLKDKVDEGLKAIQATIKNSKLDKAIDFSRPLGMYGIVNPDNLLDSNAILLLPVADEKILLDLLANFGMTPEKGGDGVYMVQPPRGNPAFPLPPVPIYLRFTNKHVYVAHNKTGVAKESILEPSKIFTGKTSTFFTALRFSQISDELKQKAVNQLEEQLDKEKQKKLEGETKGEAEIRRKAMDAIGKQMAQIIKDAEELAFSFNVNRHSNRLNAELTFTAKPGSSLAKTIADAGKQQGLFGGLAKSDAAINILIHGTLPEDARKVIDTAIDEAFKKQLAKRDDADERKLAQKVYDAIEPTVNSGEVEAALSFEGLTKQGHLTMVGALKLKGGEKVEQMLKDLVNAAPDTDKAKFHFDAENSGRFKIHRVDDFLDDEGRRAVGKHPLYIAFRPDAFFLSAGPNGLNAIKQALTAEPKPSPPLLFEVSIMRLAAWDLAQSQGDKSRRMDSAKIEKLAKEAFTGDNDKIRLTLKGGKSLKASFDMSTAVIKFAGLMVTQEQR
jgi:hypothetical protein